MKPEKRKRARDLRRDGWSVKDITRELGVSKSSVSTWVRDIELTAEQREALHQRRSPRHRGQFKGAEAVVAKYRAQRLKYQQEGREKAREMDPLHMAGCMLYWAEGRKARNTLTFVNSDTAMLKFYIRFLRQCFEISPEHIKVRINCYLDEGEAFEDVKQFWLNLLELPTGCLADSHTLNNIPVSSQQQGRKITYGTCEIAVHSTQLVQHVYGAIQEYSGIDNPEWLD